MLFIKESSEENLFYVLTTKINVWSLQMNI